MLKLIRLRREGRLDDSLKEERETLMVEFVDLIRKETSSWRQKAKNAILAKGGDWNSIFLSWDD